MREFLCRLFDRSGFVAHQNSPSWTAELLWLHNAADIAIWLAYLAVPGLFFYLSRQRRDVPFRWACWVAGVLIAGCGTTHLMEAITSHTPLYRLAALVKLGVAVLAWAGVLSVYMLAPKILALRNAEALEREMAERKRAEDTVVELAQRHRLILDAAGEGICGVDQEGRVTFFNQAAARMTGWSAQEVVGHKLVEVFHHTRSDGTAYRPEECPLRAALADGRVRRLDTDRFWRKDGTSFPAEYMITPVREGGALAGVVVTFNDITAWKRSEEALRRIHEELEMRVQLRTAELRQTNAMLEDQMRERQRAAEERIELLSREQEARAEAEAANRTKDEFLATLSHELRTPLNSMLGWTRILRGERLERSTFRRGLETIERNIKIQTQLINDLLDVSRIITGKLRLEVGQIELTPVIEAAIDAIRPAADAKLIRVESRLEGSAGPVSGDTDRLQQVVWNLLANAIKFTPRGGRVSVRMQRLGSHVEVAVKDSGEGISPEFLPHVFDRFRQADSTITRTHTGLGLGLAIVRHLVELHGGTVHAASDGLGQGATFTFRLPVASVRIEIAAGESNAAAVVATLPEAAADLEGLRVLVVDDEADVRELLALVLERCGAAVETVDSAGKAIEAFEWVKPDVLVSDIGMPREDGYALLRRVRALPAAHGGNAPAIALTAYAKPEDRRRALTSGFAMHLPKPVEPADLVAAVAKLAGRAGQMQAAC